MIAFVQANPNQALTVLGPLIKQGTAVKSDAWCLRHQKYCKMQTASRHIAGTVCVGFSRRGLGLSTADPTIVPTLAWISQRRHVQEAEITQENVKGCPPSLFQEFLADMYFIDIVTVDAVSFGWACGRERQFLKMRRRQKILSMISPCSRFLIRFYRACKYSWKEHFFAHDCQKDSTVLANELCGVAIGAAETFQFFP